MTLARNILVLAMTAALTACGPRGGQAGQAEEEHGHGHGAGIAVTHFTGATELVVEYPPLAVGQPSEFAAHFTHLSTPFRAVSDGVAVVRLIGPSGEERFQAPVSEVPGIFRPTATPAAAGRRRLVIELRRGGVVHAHDLGEVTVHRTKEAAERSLPAEEEEGGLVSFTKEQQWKVDFAHAPVGLRPMRASVPARVLVHAAPNAEAALSAPAAGRVEGAGAFPYVGRAVRAGEALFRLRPIGSDAGAAAGLSADRSRAAAELTAARADLGRAERLLAQGAVPRKRVEEARARAAAAQGALSAAQSGLAATGGTGGAVLRSPIAGQVVEVSVQPGGSAESGQTLARVVNPARLQVQARVAEADIGRLIQPSGLMITVPGGEPIVLQSPRARLIGVGAAVDPATRTLPVIFEAGGGEGLPIGLNAPGRVLIGLPRTTLAVPRSALVDDAGQTDVYVMADGENFERRVIRTGASEGGHVEVIEGLKAGERVVTIGAYLVRLAEAGPAAAGHGHAH